MASRQHVGRRALAGLLGVLVLASTVARAGEPVVLGRVSAANVRMLVDKAAKLAEKFAPGAGAMVMGGVGQQLMQPPLAGIDFTQPATVVLFGGKAFGKKEPVPVVVATVGDAAKLNIQLPDGVPPPFQIDVRDNFVVLAQEKDALAAITPKRLALYTKFPAFGGASDLYATFYVARAIEEYRADIDQGIKDMEESTAQLQVGGPMAIIGKVMKIWGPLVDLSGKQVRRTTLMLQLNDDNVQIAGRVYAEQDTALGTFFAGQPKEGTDLVKYLPADLVVGVAGKLDIAKTKPLVDSVLEAVGTPLEMSPDDKEQVRSLMFGNTQTGEFAGGVAGGATHQGMQTIQVVRIGDTEKFRAASKDAVEWLAKSGLGALMQAAGMQMNVDYKANAREHNGTPIDQLTVTVAQAPGAEPNPMMGQPVPQVTEIAAIGEVGIAASNNATGDLLNAAIDRIKGAGGASLATSTQYKTALAAAPKEANVVYHVLFNSMLAKAIEQVAKQQPGIALLTGGIFKADPIEEPITGYVQFGNRQIDFATRIPHQPILALTTRVRMLMEQQKKAGQPGGAGPDDDF